MDRRRNMWKQKLGISLSSGFDMPTTVNVIKLLKEIGFEKK